MTLLDRFWKKVNDTGDCWLWTAYLNPDGYGKIKTRSTGRGQGIWVPAHAFSWELHNQVEVPCGMEMDHLCRVRHCVNPAHLEAVTHRINSKRSSRQKLSAQEEIEIRALYSTGLYSQRNLASLYETSQANVSNLMRRI